MDDLSMMHAMINVVERLRRIDDDDAAICAVAAALQPILDHVITGHSKEEDKNVVGMLGLFLVAAYNAAENAPSLIEVVKYIRTPRKD